MFTQINYSDSYDREKLRILQSLNTQVQTMVVKLDQIVTQAEENIFRLKSSPTGSNSLSRSTLTNLNGSLEKSNEKLLSNQSKLFYQDLKLGNNQQLVKIEDHPPIESNKINKSSSSRKRPKSIANLSKSFEDSQQSILDDSKLRSQNNSAASINKRNKQQRIFNTFVRESINQLLGPDYMRTHDVQDIDAQVMEMIRKEAVENYLPENIRPRRAWHLAKASLRTLKRTLNNKKA